jgi:hypothetical protein
MQKAIEKLETTNPNAFISRNGWGNATKDLLMNSNSINYYNRLVNFQGANA